MNRTPEPDWDSLPDEILSVDVARLFGILPKSLSQYVKRGKIEKPRREANAAWYSKAQVKAFWRARERIQPQFYTLNNLPAPLRSEAVTAAVSALAGRADDSVTITPDEFRQTLEAGITAGITAGLSPLQSEITALRQEIERLRGDIVEAKKEGPTLPPTLWKRLWGGR